MSISVGRATRANGAFTTVADYVALAKPRVVSLLVVTGVCGYLAGAAGHVRIAVLLAVAGGGGRSPPEAPTRSTAPSIATSTQ